MTFPEALKILGIEEYQERIFKSNSHGELFHLAEYINLARWVKEKGIAPEQIKAFTEWFKEGVIEAEKKWQRPESVFQHILKGIN